MSVLLVLEGVTACLPACLPPYAWYLQTYILASEGVLSQLGLSIVRMHAHMRAAGAWSNIPLNY